MKKHAYLMGGSVLAVAVSLSAIQAQINALQSDKAVRESQKGREQARAGALADQLGGVTLQIPVRLGEQGRIYGSVTGKDIADALAEQAQITVDRHDITLGEPLKTIGVHAVPVKLAQGVTSDVQVELVPEGEAAE